MYERDMFNLCLSLINENEDSINTNTFDRRKSSKQNLCDI